MGTHKIDFYREIRKISGYSFSLELWKIFLPTLQTGAIKKYFCLPHKLSLMC